MIGGAQSRKVGSTMNTTTDENVTPRPDDRRRVVLVHGATSGPWVFDGVGGSLARC